jgi:hypothetical protein
LRIDHEEERNRREIRVTNSYVRKAVASEKSDKWPIQCFCHPSILAISPMTARNNLIIRVANGKSFIDVGGLYQVVKERISVTALDEAQSVDRTPD